MMVAKKPTWPANEPKMWPLGRIVPYPNNPRTHPPAQIALLAELMKKRGVDQPIVVDDAGMILKGHGRLLAAQLAGFTEFPVVQHRGLSDADKIAMRIEDNQVQLLSGWNADLITSELHSLKLSGYDIPLLGFPEVQLRGWGVTLGTDSAIDPEATPERPKKPVVRRGDRWCLGDHILVCGDATDKSDVAEALIAKPRMIFADPPYGMKLNADFSSEKSSLRMLREKGLKGGRKYENVIGDHNFSPAFIDCLFDSFPATSEMFLWGGDYYSELLRERTSGSWFVWDKRLEESADRMYGSGFELCWSRIRHKREIVRIKWAGVFGTEKEPDHRRHHPTQKPVELSRWFIERYSQKGDFIVDPFVGVGGTIIAAEMTARKALAIEIDPGYVQVAIERWQTFTGKLATLDGKTLEQIAKARRSGKALGGRGASKPEKAPKAANSGKPLPEAMAG